MHDAVARPDENNLVVMIGDLQNKPHREPNHKLDMIDMKTICHSSGAASMFGYRWIWKRRHGNKWKQLELQSQPVQAVGFESSKHTSSSSPFAGAEPVRTTIFCAARSDSIKEGEKFITQQLRRLASAPSQGRKCESKWRRQVDRLLLLVCRRTARKVMLLLHGYRLLATLSHSHECAGISSCFWVLKLEDNQPTPAQAELNRIPFVLDLEAAIKRTKKTVPPGVFGTNLLGQCQKSGFSDFKNVNASRMDRYRG